MTDRHDRTTAVTMSPHGIHHVTAITSNVRDNFRFYVGTLGMRLVKRTVNQDDVRAYHLFYADGAGSPGTDLTFFDFGIPSEVRGNRSITRTSLRVSSEADLAWWEAHLRSKGIETDVPRIVAGRWTIDVEDPEGQRLALVVDDDLGEAVTWERSTIPASRQVRGLGPVHLTVPSLRGSERLWTEVFGLTHASTYDHAGRDVHVFAMGGGGAHAELHVRVDPSLPAGRSGAGGVHHVALRVHDHEYAAWERRLNDAGVPNSGPVDRYWFKSLYVRDGNGILFELATDGPGFAVDEDPSSLGEVLVLPPFLEPYRVRIEAGLQPLDLGV